MSEAGMVLGMFFAILSIPVSSVQVICSPCSSVGSAWAAASSVVLCVQAQTRP